MADTDGSAGRGPRPGRPGGPGRAGGRDLVGRLVRAAGWLLVLVAFLPLRALFGDPPGTRWLIGPGEWLLGLFVFGTVAWLLARTVPEWVERSVSGLGRLLARPTETAFRAAALAALAALLLLASLGAFSRHPLLIDSIIQLFQAKIFASGAAWVPAPSPEAFFTTQHMIAEGGRWYSQYPPGHPGALAVGVWIGAPWLVPILLTLASAWLIADFARRVFGATAGRLTFVLLVLAPFFWFMGASHMNHVTVLFFIALFLWLFRRWEERIETDPDGRRSPAWMLLAGLALGAAFLGRPLTAVAVGLAFAIPALRAAGPRWPGAAVAGFAGVLGAASLYLLFNAATTGHPLEPGYLVLWGAEHGLGFHDTPWGDHHSPLTGLRNELIDLSLLHSFLFEWPVPALLPLGGALAAGWVGGQRTGEAGSIGGPGEGAGARRGGRGEEPGSAPDPEARWERRLLGAFLAIPAAYFFYWHRDAFLGPRYLYEGLPFLAPLTARAFLSLRDRLAGRSIGWLGGVDARAWVSAVILLAFAYSALYATPQRYRVYATGLASFKLDLVEEARDAGIEEGLIFVAVSWGNRLIARARGAGASASVVEIVYRRSDHCELDETVRRAEADSWEPARLDAALTELIRPTELLIDTAELNGDRTLRLARGKALSDACRREILYDREGYTNYAPHFVANDPRLEGPFVIARDLGLERAAALRRRYPDRPAYLYRPGRFLPLGTGGSAETDPGETGQGPPR